MSKKTTVDLGASAPKKLDGVSIRLDGFEKITTAISNLSKSFGMSGIAAAAANEALLKLGKQLELTKLHQKEKDYDALMAAGVNHDVAVKAVFSEKTRKGSTVAIKTPKFATVVHSSDDEISHGTPAARLGFRISKALHLTRDDAEHVLTCIMMGARPRAEVGVVIERVSSEDAIRLYRANENGYANVFTIGDDELKHVGAQFSSGFGQFGSQTVTDMNQIAEPPVRKIILPDEE